MRFLWKRRQSHVLEIVNKSAKYKGIGVCNLQEILSGVDIGDEVLIGQKYFTRMPSNLPELVSGMARRAQTISSKDAGIFIAKLGIGTGSTVLEGFGIWRLITSSCKSSWKFRSLSHCRAKKRTRRSRAREPSKSLILFS